MAPVNHRSPWIWLPRVVLAAVFLYAGVTKARNPAEFAWTIDNYQLLPWTGAAAVALYLPWLEIVASFALLISRWRHGALAILTGLTLAFIVALTSALWRGLDIACGCFGDSHATSLTFALERAVGLLAVCSVLWWLERRPPSAGTAAGVPRA